MPITTDWQAELAGSFLMGAETDYSPALSRLPSFGTPGHRGDDMARGNLPGDVASADVDVSRVIAWPYRIRQPAADPAGTLLAELKSAWRLRSSDTTFDVRLPGLGTRRYYGRPRLVDADLSNLALGVVTGQCIFAALDPFGYDVAPTDVAAGSSPLATTVGGDVPTDRFTITITGNGGRPVLTSVTDGGLTVRFAQPLTGTAVLDFRARTVRVGGVDRYSWLSPGPLWFRLHPGSNTVNFSGCAGIEVSYRAAHL